MYVCMHAFVCMHIVVDVSYSNQYTTNIYGRVGFHLKAFLLNYTKICTVYVCMYV